MWYLTWKAFLKGQCNQYVFVSAKPNTYPNQSIKKAKWSHSFEQPNKYRDEGSSNERHHFASPSLIRVTKWHHFILTAPFWGSLCLFWIQVGKPFFLASYPWTVVLLVTVWMVFIKKENQKLCHPVFGSPIFFQVWKSAHWSVIQWIVWESVGRGFEKI